MPFTVIIPARFASTRLPGKPLLDIAGRPMLQHVYERASASAARAVYIATDDERIASAARGFGAPVCMTASGHQSGTDRIQEVCRALKLEQSEIVVNVQGDEPLIPPEAIDQVADNLRCHEAAGISSLYEEIRDSSEFYNPNAVKVVTDQQGFALYFSRAPIPYGAGSWGADSPQALGLRHIGIYGYRVSTLNRFVTWPQSPLEISERLEQLRAMSYGVRIFMERAVVDMPAGVDTPEDLEAVRRLLAGSA